VWKAVEAALPSREGYRIVGVWNSTMAADDADARQARIEKAFNGIDALQQKLWGPRCRLRLPGAVEAEARGILKAAGAERWV